MDKNKLCFICPSKGRVEELERMIMSFVENSSIADLYVVIDSDDTKYMNHFTEDVITNYKKDRVFFILNSIDFNGAFLHILNYYALEKVDDYDLIGFLEDDVYIKTKGFDTAIADCGDFNVIYTNDLLNTPTLVSLPIIKSDIVAKLGYYSPPQLKCLWADYFWKLLGLELNSMVYLENIILIHEHFSRNDNTKVADEISDDITRIGKSDAIAWSSNRENILYEVRCLK